jgi:hypothetical protein
VCLEHLWGRQPAWLPCHFPSWPGPGRQLGPRLCTWHPLLAAGARAASASPPPPQARRTRLRTRGRPWRCQQQQASCQRGSTSSAGPGCSSPRQQRQRRQQQQEAQEGAEGGRLRRAQSMPQVPQVLLATMRTSGSSTSSSTSSTTGWKPRLPTARRLTLRASSTSSRTSSRTSSSSTARWAWIRRRRPWCGRCSSSSSSSSSGLAGWSCLQVGGAAHHSMRSQPPRPPRLPAPRTLPRRSHQPPAQPALP